MKFCRHLRACDRTWKEGKASSEAAVKCRVEGCLGAGHGWDDNRPPIHIIIADENGCSGIEVKSF